MAPRGNHSRQVYSCDPCRARKVKCDRTSNCSNCQRRREVCVWSQPPPPPQDSVASQASLLDRIERLESLLESQVTSNSPRPLENDSVEATPAPHPSRGHTAEQGDEITDLLNPRRSQSDTGEVARHDEFDHQILIASRGSSVVQASTYHRQLIHYKTALPTHGVCSRLVELYLEKLEWMHHVIDVPDFCEWHQRFWSNASGQSRWQHELCQLALLFSILCLAVHFDLDLDLEPHERAELKPDRFYHQESHNILRISGYLRWHSIPAIQTLIMQGLYLVNIGESDAHHANLALAIRMANTLGLSKLDAVSRRASTAQAVPTSFSAREAELGRRIYWSLVCQDAYTASSCNFTYSIVPGQIKCRRPANITDKDLANCALTNHQWETSAMQPTTMLYHILKIDFALVAKRFVDLYNEEALDHAATLLLEKELWTLYWALPTMLKPLASNAPGTTMTAGTLGWGNGLTTRWDPASIYTKQMGWQRLFMGITVHNRIMRLHRPFLARGYFDDTFKTSRESTVKSAHALMDLIAQGRDVESFPGLRWWVVLVHVFTAAVTICVDMHFTRHTTPGVHRQHEHGDRNLHLALDVLRSAASRSRAASQAVKIIQTLMQRVRNDVPSTVSKHTRRLDRPMVASAAPTSKRARVDNITIASNATSASASDSASPTVAATPWRSDLQRWMGSEWTGFFHLPELNEDPPAVQGQRDFAVDSDAFSSELWSTIETFASSLGSAPNPSPPS